MTEREIQRRFASRAGWRFSGAILPNAYIDWAAGGWECDLLGVTRAGYVYEWEIKLDRTDFRREFEKKREKHAVLSGARYTTRLTPKRFWFVCPAHVIECVPCYAGLIWVTRKIPRGWVTPITKFTEVVVAPRLPSRKATPHEIALLLSKASSRLWAEIYRAEELEQQRAELPAALLVQEGGEQ